MKKYNNAILAVLVIFMLFVTPVAAWTKYDGIINPYLVGGKVIKDGDLISGITITIKNLNTGYQDTKTTNSQGEWTYGLTNMLVPNSWVRPYDIGHEIRKGYF